MPNEIQIHSIIHNIKYTIVSYYNSELHENI